MSLHPLHDLSIPEETHRIAKAAFPKGNTYMRMRDELGLIYADEQFAELFSSRGQPAASPARLSRKTRGSRSSSSRAPIPLGDSVQTAASRHLLPLRSGSACKMTWNTISTRARRASGAFAASRHTSRMAVIARPE